MSNSNSTSMTYSVFRYLSGFHFIFGTSTNLAIIILTLVRPRLRNNATFVFCSFVAVASLFYFCIVSSVSFIDQLAGLYLERRSIIWCRIEAFLTSFTLHWTIWIVLFYNFELYLSVRTPNFRKMYVTCKRAIILCVCLGLILVPLESSSWFIQESIYETNSSIVCLVTVANTQPQVFSVLFVVNYYFNSIVPLSIILVLNGLFVKEIVTKKQRILITQREGETRKHIKNDIYSTFIVAVSNSIGMILVILPHTVITMIANQNPNDSSLFAYEISNFIIFTLLTFNLFAYLFNKIFRNEVRTIVLCNRR